MNGDEPPAGTTAGTSQCGSGENDERRRDADPVRPACSSLAPLGDFTISQLMHRDLCVKTHVILHAVLHVSMQRNLHFILHW